MSQLVPNIGQPYSSQSTAADSQRNIQDQEDLRDAISGLLGLANAQDQVVSTSRENHGAIEQSVTVNQAQTKNRKNRTKWLDTHTAKLIRLKVEDPKRPYQELVPVFNSRYDNRQISIRVKHLHKTYQKNIKALAKYVGLEELTKAQLEKFMAMTPEEISPQKGITTEWSDENTAKLIKLGGETPKRTYQELIPEFENQYDKKQISARMSSLYRAYRNKSDDLTKYVGKAGLTEANLKKFIEEMPNNGGSKKKGMWPSEAVAKLIRLKVEHPKRTYQELVPEFANQYTERNLRDRLSHVYREYRKNPEVLAKYVGKADLTEAQLKIFIENIPNQSRSNPRANWLRKDIAKLIRLKAESPFKRAREFISEFEGNKYTEMQIAQRVANLYSDYRNNPEVLARYVGKADLTEAQLETFIKRIPKRGPPKKTIKWTYEETAKLIKQVAKYPEWTCRKRSAMFKNQFDESQIQARLVNLYKIYRKNNMGLEGYVGKDGLTNEHLKKFIEKIPNKDGSKKKVFWPNENIAKLIRLKAENLDKTAREFISEFEENKYSALQIARRLVNLYRAYRQNNEALEKYVGLEELTNALLETFIENIPYENYHEKGKIWPMSDAAKLIRLKAENPGKVAREFISEFEEEKYNTRQIQSKLTILYKEYRHDPNAFLEKYVGKADLTKAQLETFIENIPNSGHPTKKVTWSFDDVIKLIKLKIEDPNLTHQELSHEFENRYNSKQISHRVLTLYRLHRGKGPGLKKYVKPGGLTEDQLNKFIENIPAVDVSKKMVAWSDRDVAKLISLKVKYPTKRHREFSAELGSQYDERRITHRLSNLYKLYRINNKSLKQYEGLEGLTKAQIEKFIEMIPRTAEPIKKVKWLIRDVAKLIMLKVENPNRTPQELVDKFKKRYDEDQIRKKIANLNDNYRTKKKLKRYLGIEGLTEAQLKTFIENIPRTANPKKKVKWLIRDIAKLIRLKAENPERLYRDLVPEFDRDYGEEGLRGKVSNLLLEYRRKEQALEKYVGKAGLTKDQLETFKGLTSKANMREKKNFWSDQDVAKLIRLKVENPKRPYRSLVTEFGRRFTEFQISQKIVGLNKKYRMNGSFEGYVGKASLTEAQLEQFIRQIPEARV